MQFKRETKLFSEPPMVNEFITNKIFFMPFLLYG